MSVKEGVYWIRNLEDNRVLDLSQANVAAGTNIENADQQDTFNGLFNQLWIVERFASRDKYIIRNVHSNLVLDIHAVDDHDGTPIACWDGHGGANQQWRLEWNKDVDGTAYYHIISVDASKAISHSVNGALRVAGGWSVDNNDNKQLWSFTPFIHPLAYRLRIKTTDRVLDFADASSANGTPVVACDQHTATTKRNQLWRLPIKPGSEGYTIQNLESSTVADPGGADNGVIGWEGHGGRNQQWKLNTLADGYQEIVNVSSGLAMDDGPSHVGVYESHGGGNQQWFLDPVPSPGPGWVLIQNGATGKFLSSDTPENIGTSDGPVTVFDESVQWRFLEKGAPGIYTLVNRATGYFLSQLSSRPSISMAWSADNEGGDWWILEKYKNSDAGLVSIISKQTNNTLDHYHGQSVEALDTSTASLHRAWKIMPANDQITSFALLNGETGHGLAVQGRTGDPLISAANAVKNFDAQWIFRKVDQGPLFAIHNKANNHILAGPTARWELVPSRNKYFGLRETTTGVYLGAENGRPTLEATDLTDRPQGWELVSDRTPDGLHDLLYLDDDLLEVLLLLLTNGDEREQIGQHIDRRAPQKPAKDVSERQPPTRARVRPADNPTVHQLLHALIDRWKWDAVPEPYDAAAGQAIQTLASLDAATAETAITGQRLPQSIRRVYDTSPSPATVFQLTCHGPFTTPTDNNNNQQQQQQQQQYITLQGQYGAHTYFQVALPHSGGGDGGGGGGGGVPFGREAIRSFLRASLEARTTVVVVAATTTPTTTTMTTTTTCSAGGGPPYERDAGRGGRKNAWVGWARALLAAGTVGGTAAGTAGMRGGAAAAAAAWL